MQKAAETKSRVVVFSRKMLPSVIYPSFAGNSVLCKTTEFIALDSRPTIVQFSF